MDDILSIIVLNKFDTGVIKHALSVLLVASHFGCGGRGFIDRQLKIAKMRGKRLRKVPIGTASEQLMRRFEAHTKSVIILKGIQS